MRGQCGAPVRSAGARLWVLAHNHVGLAVQPLPWCSEVSVPGKVGQGQLQASGPFHEERMRPLPGGPAVDVRLWRRLAWSPPAAGQVAELGLAFPASVADAGKQEADRVRAWPWQRLPYTISRATSVCWIPPRSGSHRPKQNFTCSLLGTSLATEATLVPPFGQLYYCPSPAHLYMTYCQARSLPAWIDAVHFFNFFYLCQNIFLEWSHILACH